MNYLLHASEQLVVFAINIISVLLVYFVINIAITEFSVSVASSDNSCHRLVYAQFNF